MARTARILAMANQKGGVAKTTTTLNLAVALREKGMRVLVVDLDPQSNLSMSQGIDVENLDVGMFDVLVRSMPVSEIVHVREIDVAPAGIELAGAEMALSSMIGRERALSRALQPLAKSYMVGRMPKISTLGFRCSRTCPRVCCNWARPRRDRYSHCTGTITPWAATIALMVSRPSDGGVSMRM